MKIHSVAVLPVVLALGSFLLGQCATSWVATSSSLGANNSVSKTAMWDPDGAGPLTPRLVVAGSFTSVVGIATTGIAVWDPATDTWSSLGGGLNGGVFALLPLPNGELVVGGEFSVAGGGTSGCVAKWNGVAWVPVGNTTGVVYALTATPTGDIVAGGRFTLGLGGGVIATNIARWNGTAWSAFGGGLTGPPSPPPSIPTWSVNAVTTLANGDVVAGGYFQQPVSHLARWNGTAWVAFGDPTSPVYALRRLPSGDIAVGGAFASIGGSNLPHLAVWNGSTWSGIGAPPNWHVNGFDEAPNGDLIVCGTFLAVGSPLVGAVARWDGTSWSAFGGPLVSATQSVTALSNTEVVAGGSLTSAGGAAVQNLARWNGSTWSAFSSGPLFAPNTVVDAVQPRFDGSVVIGGNFTAVGGMPASRIARWDGSAWSALGAGTNDWVTTLAERSDGSLFAGGVFTVAGGVAANGVARWDGASWSPLGSGLNASPWAMVALPNDDIVVCGPFTTAGGIAANGIARWNGTTWSPLGSGIGNYVIALAALPNGDVVAGGFFANAGGTPVGNIARWNGATWSSLGGTNSGVRALTTTPNGDLVAAGDFSTAGGVSCNRVARWNGSSWAPMGSGLGGLNGGVTMLTTLPDGDVVATGTFQTAGIGGSSVSRIARWDGSVWQAFDAGVDNEPRALAFSSTLQLIVGGGFTVVGGIASPFLARITTSCPADVAVSGTGCPSSGGSNTLTATTLPWVNATFRATGSGLPSTAIVLALTSVTSIPQGIAPLSGVFPQAGAGCDVLVNPDILQVSVTITGTAQSELSLPNTPPLVGVTFFHQMVPIEVDPQGAWTSVTATNALQLTAGAF